MRHRDGTDCGNASIALLGGAAMVMVFLVGLADLAGFFMARTRAQTAADFASLAAAAELIPAIGIDPEQKAAEYADANGAVLTSCECEMGTTSAIVTVSVPVRMVLPGLSGTTEVTAQARADVNLPPGAP